MKGFLWSVGLVVAIVIVGGIFLIAEDKPKGIGLPQRQTAARGVIIPHHAVAEPLIRRGITALAESPGWPAVILLIVPNHGEIGNAPIITSEGWLNEGHLCTPKFRAIKTLPEIVDKEPTVKEMVPWIQRQWPQVPIVPLLISSRIAEAEVETLVGQLGKCREAKAIAAIDFSHYLTSESADEKDKFTWNLIQSRADKQLRTLNNSYLDAPAALVVFLNLMDKWGSNQSSLLAHDNSGRRLGDLTAATTSYLVVLFSGESSLQAGDL